MKTTITAKQMQIPQTFDEYAEKKINAKLNKFFGEDATAKVLISEHKNLIIIEVTVRYNGIIFRAEQSAVDKEDALDACVDKIIRQIRKHKTKVEKRLKEPYRTHVPLSVEGRLLLSIRVTGCRTSQMRRSRSCRPQ